MPASKGGTARPLSSDPVVDRVCSEQAGTPTRSYSRRRAPAADQPLNATDVIPVMSCRWKIRKTMITGINPSVAVDKRLGA